jgi:hypothetical protein
MIRRTCAKSSLSYPEVFHRFCGYLCDRARRARIFFGAAPCVLSSREIPELLRAAKKIRELPREAGHAEDAAEFGVGQASA